MANVELIEGERVAYVKEMQDYLQQLKRMNKRDAQKKSFENLVRSGIICENGEYKHDRCYYTPNSTCDKIRTDKMVNKKSWDEFRNNGLLWWINMILHTLGWAIVTELEDNKVIKAYPARVKFRGFKEKNNTEGYIKVSQYMKENANELLKESID